MRYAWDGLRRRPARSTATVLGVGLAVALVVLLLALSSGITRSATELAQSSGVDLLATTAPLATTTFPPVPDAHRLPAEMSATDPNIVSASPWLVANVVFGNATLYREANASPGGAGIPVGGRPTGSEIVGWIPGANGGIEVPPITAGPGFSSEGDPHWANGTFTGPAPHEIVLDGALAAVLNVTVGSPVWAASAPPVGPAALAGWYSNATEFRVVGLSGPFWLIPSALLAFGYLSEVQELLGGVDLSEDAATVVLIHLAQPSDSAADATRLAAAFPWLTIITVAEILGAVQNVVDLYRTFGTLIGAVGFTVAALFTTAVLTMSVDDRSREMALLRALGFSPAWIGREIAAEGLLLAGLGLAVGAPLGAVGALALDRFLTHLVPGLPDGFSFVSFDAPVVALTLLLVLVLGLAASVLPILQALRLPVAAELRAP